MAGQSRSVGPGPQQGVSTAAPGRGRLIRPLAITAYLAVGVFPYLASGLLVPPTAVAALMACWGIGLVVMLAAAKRRPLIAPSAVGLALLFWFAFVTVGSALFGWTA